MHHLFHFTRHETTPDLTSKKNLPVLTKASFESFKDLGVTIDLSLKYKEHIVDIVAKAWQKASLVFK